MWNSFSASVHHCSPDTCITFKYLENRLKMFALEWTFKMENFVVVVLLGMLSFAQKYWRNTQIVPLIARSAQCSPMDKTGDFKCCNEYVCIADQPSLTHGTHFILIQFSLYFFVNCFSHENGQWIVTFNGPTTYELQLPFSVFSKLGSVQHT